MKKIMIILLVLCTCLSGTVRAFELESIGPETSFLDKLNRDVTGDIDYLRSIAFAYKDKYVVTEEKYLDISSIDKFYAQLSAPLTLAEIDDGNRLMFLIITLGKNSIFSRLLGGYQAARLSLSLFAILASTVILLWLADTVDTKGTLMMQGPRIGNISVMLKI